MFRPDAAGDVYPGKGAGKGMGYTGPLASNQAGLYTMQNGGYGMQQNLAMQSGAYGNVNQNRASCNGCGLWVLLSGFALAAIMASALVLRTNGWSMEWSMENGMKWSKTVHQQPQLLTSLAATAAPAAAPIMQQSIPAAYSDVVAPAQTTAPVSIPSVALPVPAVAPAPAPVVLDAAPLTAAERATTIGLADHIADSNVLLRCMPNNSQREIVEDLFKGTHVQGGKFGSVTLSAKAQLLKDTLEKKGFKHRKLYHGTMSDALSPILNGGFLCPHAAFRGMGIYAAGTMSHAECYSDHGEPVLHLQVYYKEDKDDRYISQVFAANEMDDSYIVTDPLTIFPVEVIECCPVKRTCM